MATVTAFTVIITLVNNEEITRLMNGVEVKKFRNTVWTVGTTKNLPNGSVELISPLVIRKIIINPPVK